MPASVPDLKPALGPGWALKDEDTSGEWDLRMILEETGAADPEGAAAGWGGGSMRYYSKSDGTSLVMMHTRWDTVKDADEFEAAMRQGLDKLHKDGTVWTDNGRFFALKRVDSHLWYIASTHRGALEAAWQAAK